MSAHRDQSEPTVQDDLKGSRRKKVSLHHVAKEESHETREDLRMGKNDG